MDIELIKAIIRTNNLNNADEKNIKTAWFKKWVESFALALLDGQLNESFHQFLKEKIAAQNQESPLHFNRYTKEQVFLYELFLIANHEYQWLDASKFDRDAVIYYIENALPDSEKTNPLKDQYQLFIQQWFTEELQAADRANKDEWYTQVFRTFFKAYSVGMLDVDLKHLSCLVQHANDEVIIKQDNYRFFHEIVKQYCQEHPVEECQEIFEYNEHIQQLMHQADENQVHCKKLDEQFNSQIWRHITNLKDVKKITIDFAENNLATQTHFTLINLIEKRTFELIHIRQNDETRFMFNTQKGISNHQWLKDDDLDEAKVLWQLALLGKSENRYGFSFSRNTSPHVYRLAQEALKRPSEEIVLDDTIPFSLLGQMGMECFLQALESKFREDIRTKKIDKPYTLYIPHKQSPTTALTADTLQGFNKHLHWKMKYDQDFVLCFHKLTMTVDFSNDVVDAFCQLLILLDQKQLKQFTVNVQHIEQKDLDKIAETLKNIAHTLVSFTGQLTLEQNLSLEDINDKQLQLVVPKAFTDDKKIESKQGSIANQPNPITVARIQAALDQQVELQPVQGKLGTQNQHHYHQEVKKQAEVTVLQSWQVEENKQVKQENKNNSLFYNGKDKDKLINWFDIQAAMDINHVNHQAAKRKLGDEILAYRFKDRNLKDLWQRVTGDIGLTQQTKKGQLANIGHPFYSRHVPKQVSKEVMLMIVRHPYDFQDGVSLNSLPKDIGFTEMEGALFADSEDLFKLHRNDEPASSRVPLRAADKPIASYFKLLLSSGIPSALFFKELQKTFSDYDCWQMYRKCFSALNMFNEKGIQVINALMNQALRAHSPFEANIKEELRTSIPSSALRAPSPHVWGEGKKEQLLKYLIQVIPFYHYQKMLLDNSELQNKQVDFDLHMQNNYRKGDLEALTPDEMMALPIALREQIHASIIQIMSDQTYLVGNDDNQQQVLLDLLSQMLSHSDVGWADKPRNANQPLGLSAQPTLEQMQSLGPKNTFKLIELVASQHPNAVSNVFLTLSSIQQTWGDKGLEDFTRVFITPCINLLDLAKPEQQQAIAKLLTLTPVQYHWWQQLSAQHAEQSGYSDVAVLMQAFQSFLDELETLGLKNALMLPCPLQGISNMPVGLERVLSVLKKAKKPVEQFQLLDQLDWSACGVIVATNENEFQYVTSTMKLNVAEENAMEQFISQANEYPHYRKFNHHQVELLRIHSHTMPKLDDNLKQQLFPLTLTAFYRFISSKKYTAPMSVYQQYLDALVLPEGYTFIPRMDAYSTRSVNGKYVYNLHPVTPEFILSALLKLVANATTGPRALDRMPTTQEERTKQLSNLLNTLYACAEVHFSQPEIEELYKNLKLVCYEEIMNYLENAIELCEVDSISEDEFGKAPRLDLVEITTVLQLIKRSAEFHRNDKSEVINKLRGMDVWNRDVFGRTDNQGLFTRELLGKYKQYFVDALSRFQRFNPQGDYASFILLSLHLEKTGLSYENKGRLLRLLSLVQLSIPNLVNDIASFESFLKALTQYQTQHGTEALDAFITALSSIIPAGSGHLSMTQLNRVLENCLIQPPLDLRTNLPAFINTHLPGCSVDVLLDEVQDSDFFATPHELDLQYQGLGRFYKSLKTIMLQKYPVAFGEDKVQGWKDFFTLIQQLEQAPLQKDVLQAIVASNHPGLCLTKLNTWLRVLLKVEKDRVPVNPKFITALSSDLLHYVAEDADAPQFIAIAERWFHYSFFRQTERDNLAFIGILNKLVIYASGRKAKPLDPSMIDAIFSFYYLRWNESTHWDEQYIHVLNVVEQQKLSSADLFKGIIGLSKLADKDQNQRKVIHALLEHLISNIETTWPIILKLSKEWEHADSNRLLKMMLVLGHAKDSINTLYEFLQKLDSQQLEMLASCYQTKPIPSSVLLNQLVTHVIDLKQFIAEHNRDPHHERTEDKLKQQFDDGALWPYLDRVSYLDEKQILNLKQIIAAQFKWINRVGHDEIRLLSMESIRDRLQDIRELISKSDPDQKEVHQLTAISLIREAIYKTSQRPVLLWPTPVQMLALLNSLNHSFASDDPLFLQMATGEGKSLFALMQGLLHWVNGKGVAIVMHRASHALRDAKAFRPLLDALGIESEHLTTDSYRLQKVLTRIEELLPIHIKKPKKNEFDGIYYVEFNEFALIRQQEILDEQNDLSQLAFVIDEADEIILHNQTENNLSQKDQQPVHVNAWVFEALAAYLETHAQQKSHKVSDIVRYLNEHYPQALRASQQVNFLEKLPSYLEASWQADSLKEKVDFIPKKTAKDSTLYYAAVLLNDKAMPANVTFNGIVQQALHGRLNYQTKKQQGLQYYHVEPETTLYSTMSPEAMLKWMVQTGPVILVSATIGAKSERQEMNLQHGIKFIKFPKMQSMQRIDHPEQFCPDKLVQLKEITKICEYYTTERTQNKSRTILITVDSIDFAEDIKHHLQKLAFKPEVLHAGEEVDDKTMTEVESRAGKSNHILIAMNGLIERGFDIKLSTATQTVVIATDLSNQITEDQKKGRASRLNPKTGKRDKGKFYGVYDLEKERQRYPHLNIAINDLAINPELFKKRQYFGHYQQESAIRLQRQLACISKDTIQSHFNEFWISLKNMALLAEQREEILRLYTGILNKIITVVPHAGFTQDNAKGQMVREQYNKQIIDIYAECVEKAHNIIGQHEGTAPELLLPMKNQQQQLLKINANAIKTGPDQAQLKIYKQWKHGVNYNAYLDAGKQGTGNFLMNAVSGLFLSSDNKSKLIEGKEQLAEKLKVKEGKKTDFLTPLTLMMDVSRNQEDSVLHYQKIYKQLQQEPMLLNSSILEEELFAVSTHFGLHSKIQFIYDPLAGKSAQIILSSSSFKPFKILHTAINETYEAMQGTMKLHFRVGKIENTYQVIIDFSSHVFDSIDRKRWLQLIAEKLTINISALFKNTHIPPLKTMQKVLADLSWQPKENAVTRVDYYCKVYKRALNSLWRNDISTKALTAAENKNGISYPDIDGTLLTAMPAPFNNLEDVINNYIKRQVIDYIQKQLEENADNPCANTLLYKQQTESLRLLCKMMAVNDLKTAKEIYHDFEQRTFVGFGKEMSFLELMQLRTEYKYYLYAAVPSPDFSKVGEEISGLIHGTVEPEHGYKVTI